MKKYRNTLFYFGVTGGFTALMYCIIREGKHLEVKKTIDSAELLKGVKQATEARGLGGETFARPFTAVIAFDSKIQTERKKFNALGSKTIVYKISQSNSQCKRNHNTGVAYNNCFFGPVFQHFDIEFHSYDKHKEYQSNLAQEF